MAKRGRKPTEDPPTAQINVRLQPGLLQKLDDAIERGLFRNRSEAVRNALVFMLAAQDPAIERMTDELVQYLNNPILPKFAAATAEIIQELTPQKIGDVVEILAGPLSDYFSAVVPGVSSQELRKQLVDAMKVST